MTTESLFSGCVVSTTSAERFSLNFCATLLPVQQVVSEVDVRGIPTWQLHPQLSQPVCAAEGERDADPASAPLR